MDSKQYMLAGITTSAQLDDYVAREFARVNGEDTQSSMYSIPDDWSPVESGRDMDARVPVFLRSPYYR